MGSGWMQCFDMGLIISMHVSRSQIQVGIILINFESFCENGFRDFLKQFWVKNS